MCRCRASFGIHFRKRYVTFYLNSWQGGHGQEHQRIYDGIHFFDRRGDMVGSVITALLIALMSKTFDYISLTLYMCILNSPLKCDDIASQIGSSPTIDQLYHVGAALKECSCSNKLKFKTDVITSAARSSCFLPQLHIYTHFPLSLL